MTTLLKGDVFLLGSGFSAAVSGGAMPTVSELEPLVEGFVREHPRLGPDWMRDEGLLIKGDLEAFFDYLVLPQPYLVEPDRLRNRAAFMTIGEMLADHLTDCQASTLERARRDWVAPLVAAWHANQLDILTLNYDTLVESTLAFLQVAPADTGIPLAAEDALAVPIRFARSRGMFGGQSLPTGALPTLRLHKLHGSLSWYYPGVPGAGQPIVDVGLYTAWGKRQESSTVLRRYAPGMVPYIAPPTLAKDPYFDHEVMRQLWISAASALAATDHLFVLGYSLPPGDVTMRSLLRTTVQASAEVVVLDACEETLQRYIELFGADRVHGDVSEDSIRRFAERLA